ncbi:phage tail protein [Pseudomonas mosselii]|uniref:phage tail protein n=3 Tax=Pseudomonas mosselii TaxID=78327 RepID=UPI0038572F7B
MVDQNSQFYAILTNVGAAKQANADALGIPWKITQMGVGDANGTDPTPNATQTSLINEWRRAPLNQLKVDDKNSAIIVAEQVIPADVGGKWIREIALYDADGDMVAVANCAPTYKPLLSQGSGRTQVVRMNLIVSSASNVQLKIDPAVVLATREWVTEELARQDFKHSVQVATTAAITLSGLQTIDGVALQAGTRVLVKDQAAAKDNGLYLVAAGAWTRCSDADSDAKVTPGLLVLVEKGAANADSAWQLVSDGPINLGVSAQDYEMAFGRSGVTAGTYRSVSVDKYGRVNAASNPTTAAGYGLTDVYTKGQVDTALALKAPLASPALSGVPTAPTPTKGTNTTQVATTAFVLGEILGLVDSAPGALDTLKELAAALGNDPNFSATVLKELAKKAPLESPVFTGTPKAPSPGPLDASQNLATTDFVYSALHGSVSVDVAGAGDFILADDQASKGIIYLVGALTGDRTIILPRVMRRYTLRNATSGAFKLMVKMSVGEGVEITQGRVSNVFTGSSNTFLDQTDFISPALTGTPIAPNANVGTSTAQIATTKHVRDTLNAYGLGATNTGAVGNSGQLPTLASGHYYYPADFSPYGAYAFVQRTTYAGNRGFELANIPYTDRFWGRGSNGDGTWRLPVELAPLVGPAFGGTPTAPTAPKGTNTAQLATTGFVQVELANRLVAGGGAVTRQQPVLASPFPGASYDSSALVLREANEAGGADDREIFAPGLGFHWFGRVAGKLIMDSVGRLKWNGNPLLFGAVASQVEVDTGSTDVNVVTPAKMRLGFTFIKAGSGGSNAIKFPTWLGGFMVQWGVHTASSADAETTVTFPLEFSVVPGLASILTHDGALAQSTIVSQSRLLTTTGFQSRREDIVSTTSLVAQVRWIAVGF